jgi:hypothetical protein
MRKRTPDRVKTRAQIPLVKSSTHTADLRERNAHVNERALYRGLNPDTCYACVDQRDAFNALSIVVGPGQGVKPRTRRDIERMARTIESPFFFPRRIEFEFSCAPVDLFPATAGLPEDYLGSAIAWALKVCPVVLLCVDVAPGRGAGEAHRIDGPIQAVFRSTEETVEAWSDYLGRRIRPKQQFAVVRFETSEAQS